VLAWLYVWSKLKNDLCNHGPADDIAIPPSVSVKFRMEDFDCSQQVCFTSWCLLHGFCHEAILHRIGSIRRQQQHLLTYLQSCCTWYWYWYLYLHAKYWYFTCTGTVVLESLVLVLVLVLESLVLILVLVLVTKYLLPRRKFSYVVEMRQV